MINALKERFKISDLKEGQLQTIQAALAGRDVLCFMPTGYGKSFCFQSPAVAGYGITLVISPLVALMNDQVKSLKEIDVGAVAIHAESDRNEVLSKLSSNSTKLVYLSPERFSQEVFLKFISKRKIERVVIDEAHCISSWGNGFRPEYQLIGTFINRLSIMVGYSIPISAFTATANHRVTQDIIHYTGLNRRTAFFYKGKVVRDNIYLSMTESKDKNKDLLRLLSVSKNEPSVVYCSTIKNLNIVSKRLHSEGFHHVVFHSKLTKDAKSEAITKFMNDEVDIVVATSAFGMGINKPNIRNVFHMQFPENIEMYYQQVGRSGRDGYSSKANLIFNKKDKSLNRFMLQLSHPKFENVWSVITTLSMISECSQVDVSESDFLLASPLEMSSHELKGVLNILTSRGMVEDYSDPLDGNIRLEINDLSKNLGKDALLLSRQNAIEGFDHLFALAQSSLCRTFLIEDYFSSKKVNYYECNHCDNCVEGYKKKSVDKDTISHEELKLIFADAKKMELFSLSQIALHLLGYGVSPKSHFSFGIFKSESYKMAYGLIAMMTNKGFFIKVNENLIVNELSFKEALSKKSGVVISQEKLGQQAENKAFNKNSIYHALRCKRDEIAEKANVSPNLIMTEIQLRKLSSSPQMSKEELSKVIGEDKVLGIFETYVSLFNVET